MKNQFVQLILAAFAILSAGCATVGRPEKVFSSTVVFPAAVINEAFTELAAVDMSTESAVKRRQKRDQSTIKLLAVIDLKYMEFKPKVAEQKQSVSIITDMATLAMTVAGALTSSAGVKQNYLHGIALTTGGADVYNEHVMFKQTAGALISQMDANRKIKLAEICGDLELPLDQFPGMAALNAVLEYYEAGTVQGAIVAMQNNAKTQDGEAAKKLRAHRTKRIENNLKAAELGRGPD